MVSNSIPGGPQLCRVQLQLTPAWKLLVILKSLVSWIRCVWLGLKQNCAELWPSRNWVWDQCSRVSWRLNASFWTKHSVCNIVVCFFPYRYPHEIFCLVGTPYFKMLWVHQTLSIPVYLLSAVTEGTMLLRLKLYYFGEYSDSLGKT